MNSFLYLLEEEGEVVSQTHASSVEKAIDYFKSIGYDMYENRDLAIKPIQKDYKGTIDDLRKSNDGDAWDKWHPHF